MTEIEQQVQKDMQKLIRKYKGYVYKNAQNMFTEKGRPDLTACVPTTLKALAEYLGDIPIGIFVGLEVKRDKKTYDATLAQQVVGRKIQKAGGIWVSLDELSNLEDILYHLTKYNKEEQQ